VRRIAVLDAPSNLGLRPPTVTSVPGCAKAPGALRDHGLLTRLGARDAGCLTPPRYDPGDWRPGDGVAHAEQIAAYSRALAGRIGAILDAGEFPVILGGDCSILLGSGLAMHRLGEAVGGRIGLVFVDGHSDFRHPGNASYVGAAAGEDLALVTGRGQADLASIEGRRPYFRDIDVVVLGIRAQDEYRLDLQAAGIVTRPVPALRAEGAARSAQWARDQLVDCAGYWLHVDVDVLDPAVMPAVDAPSPGGIAFPELELLLAGLVESPHCLGVEITVFDPDYDPDGSYAAEITNAVTSGLAAARTVTPRPDLVAARADLANPAKPAHPKPAPPSPARPRPAEPEPTEPEPAEPEPALPESAQSKPSLLGPGRLRSAEPGSAEPESATPKSSLLGPGRLRSAEPGSAEPESATPKSSLLGPGRLRSAELELAEPESATPKSSLLGPARLRPAEPAPAEPELAQPAVAEPELAQPVGAEAEPEEEPFAEMPAALTPADDEPEPDDAPAEAVAPDVEPVEAAASDVEPVEAAASNVEPAAAAASDVELAEAELVELPEPEPIGAEIADAEIADAKLAEELADELPVDGLADDEPDEVEAPEPAPEPALEKPIRLASRPLGQAPLLDSEPLPATRPGMLRPRPAGDRPAADGFSLPAQRPAFDLGAGTPADLA